MSIPNHESTTPTSRPARLLAALLAAACYAPAVAEEAPAAAPAAVSLELPLSDLVTAEQPWRGTLAFRDPLGVPCTIKLELRYLDNPRSIPLTSAHTVELTAPDNAPPAVALEIDGRLLAPGEYAGTLSAAWADREAIMPFTLFRMPDAPKPFPYSTYAIDFPADPAQQDRQIAHLLEAGFNTIVPHMNALTQDRAQAYDRAARAGILFSPSMRDHDRRDPADVALWQKFPARLPDGKPAKRISCLNQPELRTRMQQTVTRYMRQYLTHPAFNGQIYFGDDLFLPSSYNRGHAALACYCDTCKADFKAKTGLEPPVTTNEGLGNQGADDPWLVWNRYRCAEQYGGYIRALMEAKQKVDPAIELGLCHGWPDNPFTAVASGIYAPLSDPTDAVSSYAYPFLRSPTVDFITHYELGRMGNRDKPIWMLGFIAGDNTLAPRWSIWQSYWNMLAAGYDNISFFSWYDKMRVESKHPEAFKRWLTDIARCGRHKDWILPIAKHWKREPSRLAALYSFTTEAFDIAPRFKGHQHTKRLASFYRKALQREVTLDILAEEEILAGMLKQYAAICLPDVRALRHDVRALIETFAAEGGIVYVPNDVLYVDAWHPNVKTYIPKAFECAPETMVELLRDRFPPKLDIKDDDVIARTFVSGAAAYHVFVNNSADRYWGMAYSYGNPAANYAAAAVVRDRPVQTKATFTGEPRHLFDCETGKPLGTTRAPLTLNLGPSWGQVVASLPTRSARLRMSMPHRVAQGETLAIAVQVRDASGKALNATLAAHVTLLTPSGRESRHGGFRSIPEGRAVLNVPLGANAETGRWRVRLTGGFPRRTLEEGFRVTPTQLAPTWLSVTTHNQPIQPKTVDEAGD